jgi:alpha-D-ribose 1-methylphosphonate 5-triphosphate synthase subunit PhnL
MPALSHLVAANNNASTSVALLLLPPRLLLLDEPTASLDAGSKQIVVDMIQRAQQRGTAVLTVSHDLDTLAKLADGQLAL